MNVQATYHPFRLLLIIALAIIGFFTVRMPWLEYPKIDVVLQGRHGVGWFTSGLFFLIALFTLGLLLSRTNSKWISGPVLVLSGFLSAIGLDKIVRFYYVWSGDYSDFFLFNIASENMTLRYGIFVLTACALLCFILILPVFSGTSQIGVKGLPNTIRYIIPAILLIAVMLFGLNKMAPTPQIGGTVISESISKNYSDMSEALDSGDYDKVVEYTHPSVYQGIGGPSKLKDMLAQLDQQSTSMQSEVSEVVKYHQEGSKIQALFHHTTTIKTEEGDQHTRGSSIAFSKDLGQTWVFAGINGRSFHEMKDWFPEIFEELDYSVQQPN